MMLVKINDTDLLAVTNGVVSGSKTYLKYRVRLVEENKITNKILYKKNDELTQINDEKLLNKLISEKNRKTRKGI